VPQPDEYMQIVVPQCLELRRFQAFAVFICPALHQLDPVLHFNLLRAKRGFAKNLVADQRLKPCLIEVGVNDLAQQPEQQRLPEDVGFHIANVIFLHLVSPRRMMIFFSRINCETRL